MKINIRNSNLLSNFNWNCVSQVHTSMRYRVSKSVSISIMRVLSSATAELCLVPASYWSLIGLALQSWRRSRQVAWKRRLASIVLHVVMFNKTEIFITTAMRPRSLYLLYKMSAFFWTKSLKFRPVFSETPFLVSLDHVTNQNINIEESNQ
jgi:hypothetical protein